MNYDIVLYNDEMFMNLLFRKDSSTQILLQNKPMSNLSDFFEQIYFRNSQPNKNVLVEILEKSKNDFIENSKSPFACEYHCKNHNAYSCLLQSPFIFLHQLNFAITSPQQMTVMLYDKLTCYETLKQWINNVPIYFMTTDGMGKLIMVMKNNIYDCKTVDVQEWMITKAQNQNFEIIGNYLKSKNNRAIIVVHDSTQTNLKILINTITGKLVGMPQSIIIPLIDFIETVASFHGKQIQLEIFNKQLEKVELEQPLEPCNHHLNKKLQCERNSIMKWSTLIQLTLNIMKIPMINVDQLMKFKSSSLIVDDGIQKQQKQKNKIFKPFGKTFLYINITKAQEEIIEIGCIMFIHNNNKTKENQFEIISQPQSFHCKPNKMKQGLEYFSNQSTIEEIVEYIYQNVIKMNTFDYIIFSNAILNTYFEKYNLSNWVDMTFDFWKRKIVEMKWKVKVISIHKLTECIWKKVNPKPSEFCEFHKRNPFKCVCAKLQSDIILLNYFNDHLNDIQQESPFLFQNEKINPNNDSSFGAVSSTDETSENNPTVDLEHQQIQCSICMNYSKNPRMTKCGHTLCEICYKKWFIDLHQMICPVCNVVLEKKDVFKLYF